MSELTDKNVAALLRERASLETRGLTDRVAQVDKQLAALGYIAEPAAEPVAAKSRRQSTRDA